MLYDSQAAKTEVITVSLENVIGTVHCLLPAPQTGACDVDRVPGYLVRLMVMQLGEALQVLATVRTPC